MAAYDYMRSGRVPFDEIQEAAWTASEGDPANMDRLVSWLDHDDSTVRYWAAQGLLILGEAARPHLEAVKAHAFDASLNTSVNCAELLYLLGETESAVSAYNRVLESEEPMARTHALNSIDCIDAPPGLFLDSCLGVLARYEVLRGQNDVRVVMWLFQKWGIDPADHGVEFTG